MALILKVKMNVTYFFIILSIVSLGNCFPATIDSCDCVFGSTDRLGKNTFLGSKDWEKPNLIRFPWSVNVVTTSDADKYGHVCCKATLISDRHVLAPASCVLPYTTLDVTEMTPNLSVSYIDISITASIQRNISTVYVHKNYNYSTRDFDISILELDEAAPYYAMDPVILPQSPLTLPPGELRAAVVHEQCLSYHSLRQMNDSIWSNDDCTKHTNITTENLLCVEISDIEDSCMDWPQYYHPIFHVRKDGSKELLGIPKGYAYEYVKSSNNITFNSFEPINYTSKTNIYSLRLITRSKEYRILKYAVVYSRVTDFLPWVQNILSDRCICDPKTSHLQSLVWKVEKCDLEKRYICPTRSDWSEQWWGKKELNQHF